MIESEAEGFIVMDLQEAPAALIIGMFADDGGIIASTVQFGIWHPPQLGALNQSLSTPPDHTTNPGLGVKLTGELKKFIVNPDVLLEKLLTTSW